MQIQGTKDFWTGIIYILVGAMFMTISRDYPLGSALKMGPAYFPALLSGLLIIIGIISLARSFMQPGTPMTGFTFRGLILVIAATIIFGLTVRGAGLIIALPLLVLVSSSASVRFRWSESLALAAGLTIFCILVFLKGLGVPLPIIGSWLAR